MAVRLETIIQRYIGLSSDTKPTGVPAGSTFYEWDKQEGYITYDGTNWTKAGSGSTGGISLDGAQPYYVAIVEGDKSGHTAVELLGVNATVTAAADVWDVTGLYTFPSAEMGMEVVSSDNTNDKAGGTGALTVKIYYLDDAFTEKTETVTMTGTSVVATEATDIYRVNRFCVATAGSGGAAAGNIDLRHLSNTPIYARITAGNTRARSFIYTVPVSKTLYVNDIHYAVSHTAANKYTTFVLQSTYCEVEDTLRTFFLPHNQVILDNGAFASTFQIPQKFEAGADLRCRVTSTGTASTAVSLRGWQE